jgi:hypothetical protein
VLKTVVVTDAATEAELMWMLEPTERREVREIMAASPVVHVGLYMWRLVACGTCGGCCG